MSKKSTSSPQEAMPGPPFLREKPKSSMSVRLHSKHGKMLPKNVAVGGKHSMRVIGRITGLRSDEYGHSMDMDLDSLQHDTDKDEENEPTSLTQAMKNRKRHPASGRFVS